MRTSRLLLEIWRGTVTSTFFTPALRQWERELHRRFTTSSNWRLYIWGSLDCTSRLANVLFPSSNVKNSSRFGEGKSTFASLDVQSSEPQMYSLQFELVVNRG